MDKPATAEANLAENMRTARELEGWSQATLAELMAKRGHRWHQATVFAVERGDRRVQLNEAVDLAELVGVPLHQLMMLPKAREVSELAHKLAGRMRRERREVQTATQGLLAAQQEAREQLTALIEPALVESPELVPASVLAEIRQSLDETPEQVASAATETWEEDRAR